MKISAITERAETLKREAEKNQRLIDAYALVEADLLKIKASNGSEPPPIMRTDLFEVEPETASTESFMELVCSLRPRDIMQRLGCPRGTVKAWRNGHRTPPQWQERHFLPALRKGGKAGR